MTQASDRPGRARRAVRLTAATALVVVGLGGLPDAAAAAPGSRLWASRYDGTASSTDDAFSLVTSSDGSSVFVTGVCAGSRRRSDYATVAYDASGGGELWSARYDGPRRLRDVATALAVSPDGSRVFVTGFSAGVTAADEDSAEDFATVAYDADTGVRLWTRRYNGPADRTDDARAVGLSPDGALVFVTGSSVGTTNATDYVTVAYDAATGRRRWMQRFNGPGTGADDHATALGVSSDGSAVFVTGGSVNDSNVPGTLAQDYATVAYDPATGDELWVRRHEVYGGATALDVSPDATVVFVTGSGSTGPPAFPYDFVTVAYDAATGDRLWSRRYGGSGSGFEIARDLEVSADGSRLYVTGKSSWSSGADDYGTVAYEAATGTRVWSRHLDGPGHFTDEAAALGVSPDGSQVYVTGVSSGSADVEEFYAQDYATLAYDAATGARLWMRRYDGPAGSSDRGYALGVGPDGSRVFVTGASPGFTSGDDYATVAYGVT